MNFNWPHRGGSALSDRTTAEADTRMKAIKRASKTLIKSVEESLRTYSKHQDIEIRKKKSTEFILGENLAGAVQCLSSDGKINEHCSPFNTVLERYANFEKTIGHMLATNDQEIAFFLGSEDTPLSKLLNEDIPAVTAAKKELDVLTKKHSNAEVLFEKEKKKLEKMAAEPEPEKENLQQQHEKIIRLQHEEESLRKDVGLEQDKVTSLLLSVISRENQYAKSVLELMKIKQVFYKNAFETISAQIPDIEKVLKETQIRPMFGEDIEDHLSATKRRIAFPIALAVSFIRDIGLNDEGLFRISTKQIKLDKLKAYLDANLPFITLLQDCDAHFFAGCLKSYLRELPVPLLGYKGKNDYVYDRWIKMVSLNSREAKIREIRYILKEELTSKVVENIQYMVKFLSEITGKCKVNKMTPGNLGIVLGPTLLRRSGSAAATELVDTDKVIKVISLLVENYNEIFPVDIAWNQYESDMNEIIAKVKELPEDDGFGSSSSSLQSRTKSFKRPISDQHGLGSGLKNMGSKLLSKFNSTFESQDGSAQVTSKESSPPE